MITSFFTKGFFFLAFFGITLISIPPSVSIYERRIENQRLEESIRKREIEFEVHAIRLSHASYPNSDAKIF